MQQFNNYLLELKQTATKLLCSNASFLMVHSLHLLLQATRGLFDQFSVVSKHHVHNSIIDVESVDFYSGRAPDLCNIPPMRFYCKADVAKKLHDQGIANVPPCLDLTGWFHFLSITVHQDNPADLESMYEDVLRYARTLGTVTVAQDITVTDTIFTAMSALWPDAAIAEAASSSSAMAEHFNP